MKKKILIVEDRWETASRIKFLLEDNNYDVIGIAASGKEAVDIAKKQKPDLIMMDIELKGSMNGIEAATQIGEFYNYLVPIIYLTDQTNPLIVNYATRDNNKVTEYFNKPIDKVRLPIKVQFMLEKSKNESVKWEEEEDKRKKIATAEKKRQAELEAEKKQLIVALAKVEEEIKELEAEKERRRNATRDFFAVKTKKDDTKYVEVKDVLFIETDRRGSGALVIMAHETYSLDKSLTKFLEDFPHKNLVRIHTSYIVNITQTDVIKKRNDSVHFKKYDTVTKATHKDMRFFVKNKNLDKWTGVLPIGRKYKKNLRAIL